MGARRACVLTVSECRHRTWAKERWISIYNIFKKGRSNWGLGLTSCDAIDPCTNKGTEKELGLWCGQVETQIRCRSIYRDLCSWDKPRGVASLEGGCWQLPSAKTSWLCSQKAWVPIQHNFSSKLLNFTCQGSSKDVHEVKWSNIPLYFFS